MISRRVSIKRLTMLLLGSAFISACGTEKPRLLSADIIARKVAKHYGEPSPKIAGVTTTESDDSTHQSMYLMGLTGHFHRDNLEATSLSFSALGNRMYVWYIRGCNSPNEEIWVDPELTAVQLTYAPDQRG